MSGERRVALVTGAASGIGAACTRLLARQGWHVVACSRRPARLEALAAEFASGAAPSITAAPVDVRDSAAVTDLVNRTAREHGRLDGVVLNAGVTLPAPADQQTDAGWRDTFATNLDGAMYVARAALPLLARHGGSLVGVSSVASHRAAPDGSAYSASKAALNMYMATLAVEFGNRGVRANTVAPGWVRTEMADSEMAELAGERGIDLERAYALATAMVPQQRPARSEEIAEVIAWLLSPSASYVNGAVIPVDGGLSAVDPGMAAFS